MVWWSKLQECINDNDYEKILSMLSEVSATICDEHSSNLLHYVIVLDNEDIIKQVIEGGCDVNAENRYGETPLMRAVETNNLKIAKLLLHAGAIHLNTNFSQEFGPLHMAVWYGFDKMVELLLEAGADVNVVDEEHSSPLHLAAQIDKVPAGSHKSYEIAKLLIEAGSDVDAVDFEAITPLHWAVKQGNYMVAELLLDSGASADVIDCKFETPLHWSVRNGSCEFSKRLIAAGADVDMVDCQGMTCLHYAVKAHNQAMVELLLEAGATPNCTDEHGNSPLHLAVRDNNMDFIKILLKAGADVNIQDDEEDVQGLTALQLAADFCFKDVILVLLEHGADVRAKCNQGYSVLHYAVMSKRSNVDDLLYVEILRLLLEHGADVSDSSCNIRTPFNSVLLLYGNELAVRLFIDHGVDLTSCKLSKSKIWPLHHAVLNKDKSVLKFLVNSHNFDIEERCSSGLSALHLAAFSNKVNCIKFLLKRGANINAGNVHGDTPLFSAVRNGHSDSVRLLLQSGADVEVKTNRNETVLSAALDVDITKIVQYVLRHIAKLEAQGNRVDQTHYEMIAEYEDLRDFYGKCKAELAAMAESFVHGSVSFYRILTAPNIGRYARNAQLISAFEAAKLAEHFPIYHDLLTERFTKELKRQALMKKALTGLSRVLRCDADTFHVVFYNIFRYVDKKDLRNLSLV